MGEMASISILFSQNEVKLDTSDETADEFDQYLNVDQSKG